MRWNLWLPEAKADEPRGSQGRSREGESGEDGQKVKSSSYQINNIMYNMINIINTVVH